MDKDSEIIDTNMNKLPIYYSPSYSVWLFGLEKLHAFDATKWGRIFEFLKKLSNGVINEESVMVPTEVTKTQLEAHHTEKYLNDLRWSSSIARIIEVYFVAIIPNFILDYVFLRKMRLQTGGTIQAAETALKYGWAINLGGGFHHASADNGEGFCVYADISMAIKNIKDKMEDPKVMIVDLDAHQGNGHEHDFAGDNDVYIMDMYNKNIYPNDTIAKEAIKKKVELKSYTTDDTYMKLLEENLNKAFDEFKPNFLLYNAGTDCLDGDRLGRLELSPAGITKRDEIVFEKAKTAKVPILMVTSGGYQWSNAEIIAKSIWNLFQQGTIDYGGHFWATG